MENMDLSLGYRNITAGSLRTPNKKSGLFNTSRKGKSISGRSTQSTQVILKTLYHVVESFGVPMPVQVTEALTFSDRNTLCSASVSNDGWAWFVIGRRLLVWLATGNRNSFSTNCRELTLPPSDLAYAADLISVFTLHGNQTVSCIASSPEGLIRYWPNISNEGISVDGSANLQGQECESIKRISPIGFILTTTSAMMSLIETSNLGGRHSVTCRPLCSPAGWFGGIGRRFSSMLFGGVHSSQTTDSKLIRVLVSDGRVAGLPTTVGHYDVYVMAGFMLQKWSLCTGETEKLLYQCNFENLILENFVQTVWNSSEENNVSITIIDVQLIDSKNPSIVMLAVASIPVSPQLHYALVIVNVDGDTAPTRISSFHLLKNIDFGIFRADTRFKKISLLTSGPSVYLYNHQYIISTPVIAGYDEPDIIDLPETNILGGVAVNSLPVFFSRIHGFVSVTPSDVLSPSDFRNNSNLTHNFDTSTVSESTIEESDYVDVSIQKDSNACLKAAFLYYVSKKSGQARTMINDMFPVDDTPAQVDATLDMVAIKVSLDLINDVPAKDPRWADVKLSDRVSLNNTLSQSLQIQSQLEEKQQALDWFLSFLREMGLWNRLGAVTWNNVTVPTVYVFAEQAEKLIASVVLRRIQQKHPQLFDSVIKAVVRDENMVSTSGLTAFDLFYRKVSIVHKALIKLVEHCEEVACREHIMQNVVKTVNDTNSILLNVLDEISVFRQEKGVVFVPNPTLMSNFSTEMLSWTAASGPDGLKDSLALQCALTLKYGIAFASPVTLKQELINQLFSLNSIVLEGWKIHVESVSDRKARHEYLSKQYETERLSLLQPLMDLEEYEFASMLAEKYLDFTILVQICDRANDNERLLYYMDKYEKKDFAQFLFSWLIREKKPDKLLTLFRSLKKHQRTLTKFLADHPTLAWLHAVFCGNYDLAADVLLNLAWLEMESIVRKKRMLTIGKLALLASGAKKPALFDRVERAIELVAYQEDIPEMVLKAFDYHIDTMRVLLPQEIIRCYICDENISADEMDFNKALDLLRYVQDDSEEEVLRREIWCKAILRDTWPADNTGITDPVNYLEKFLFFRIISVGLEKDREVLRDLPPIELLLQYEELSELTEKTSFQYLLKIGYEYYSKENDASDKSVERY